MSTDIIILLVFHFAFLLIAIFQLIKEIQRNKKINLFSYFKLYYLIFFGISPIFVLMNFNSQDLTYYFTNDIKYYYLAFIIIISFYIIFCIISKIKIKSLNNNKYVIDDKSNAFFILNTIFTFIGLLSLLLWTKAYGKPWDMIKYASEVRSGYIIVNNPYTFLKPLCKFSMLAFFSLIFCKNNKYKFMSKILIIINLFSVIIYALANDGRAFILTCILIFVCTKINNGNMHFNVKNTFKVITAIIFIFILFSKLDTITNFIKNHELKNDERASSITKVYINNFAFTYRNVINVQYNIANEKYNGSSELTDLNNILYSWVPTRLKSNHTYSLEKRNTDLHINHFGAIPSDVITSGFYKFNYFGFLIMPIIIYIILYYFEMKFNRINGKFANLIYNYIGCLICQELVSNYDLSIILFDSLYLIVGCILIRIFCTKRQESEL